MEQVILPLLHLLRTGDLVDDRDAIAVDGDPELRLVLGDRRELVGKVRCDRGHRKTASPAADR